MTGPLAPGEDVALFIDWENFKISLATGRRHPNVSALKEEVSNLGRVVVAKAYADWVTRAPELRGASQFINDPPALYAAGIEPVYVPTRLSWGGANPESVRHTRVKNSVDVKMTADCIECAHSYPNIGTFVLVSGDSDFIHVMNTLRTMGKRVVIIGVSWATSRRLVDQSDGLILYDVDVDPVVPALEPASEPVPIGNGRAPTTPAAPTPVNSGRQPRPELSEVIKEIEEIVRSERAAGGNPLLTSIKQRVMRRFPNFDEKQLGFSGFKKLMARAAQEGNIKLVTAGLVDWATMADEDVDAHGQVPSDSRSATIEEPVEIQEPKPRRRFPFRFGTGRTKNEEPAPTESILDDDEDSEAVEAPTEEVEEIVRSERAAVELPEETAVEVTGLAATEYAPAVTGFMPTESAPIESQEEEFAAFETVAAMSPELETMLAEGIAELNLPEGPGDGQDPQRISDLIIMADTLEHREGISHVAFNFLVGEVCQALEEGLKAEYGEITQRWASVYSRGYVSKMFRELSSGNVFTRGWHSWRDETSGHNRRRRTFNLQRSHPIVVQVLKDHWASGEGGEGNESAATETGVITNSQAGQWDNGFSEDAHTIAGPVADSEIDGEEGEESGNGFFSRLFSPKS
ncbi:MAG: hypothetical protein BZY81_03095 [SAR202 cluster bacterium Io17-Chloro-G4]|nr:MAG: hypothetical protein BZY81_03095 [SAR202 cluster bacterium Io17-Chloro-G4]